MGPETPPWEAALDFTVTLLSDGLFSLYWEAAEDVGARRPRRLRRPPPVPPVRWTRRIGERLNAGEAVFYEDWPSLASRKFSPGRFYLTEEGPMVFYPVESIAPAMEGFPAFTLKGLVETPQAQ